MHRNGYHGSDERAFVDHGPVQTADFDFDGIDARNGWTENGDAEPEQPAVNDYGDEHGNTIFDVDLIPLAPDSEAVIKLICRLLDSSDVRLELFTLAAAFGLNALIGGESFSKMAAGLGISKAAFSKRVIRIQQTFHLPATRAQKSQASRASYSKAQREVWKRPERQPDSILKLMRHFVEPTAYVRAPSP